VVPACFSHRPQEKFPSSFLSHQRKSLFYRKRAWRFIAPRPHAMRLVSKQQWSGTRRSRPTHNTNPVSLLETDELSDGNGVLKHHSSPQTRFLQVPHSGGKTCRAECIHTFVYKGARSYTLRAANSAHSSEHCSGARAVEQPCGSCCPERCKIPAKLMGNAPPPNRSSARENCRALRQRCPPRRSTVTPFQCLRNNSWFP